MSDKAWEDLIDLIDSQYTIDKTERDERPLEDDPKLKKIVESIYFEKDNVKFKIERTVGPRVIDKKTFYSGQGVANHAKYVYDPSETSSKVLFFKQLADGNFNEIPPEDLMATS
jgi:hypothetical protein